MAKRNRNEPHVPWLYQVLSVWAEGIERQMSVTGLKMACSELTTPIRASVAGYAFPRFHHDVQGHGSDSTTFVGPPAICKYNNVCTFYILNSLNHSF